MLDKIVALRVRNLINYYEHVSMIARNQMEFSSFVEATVSWCSDKVDVTKPRECLRSKELRTVVEKNGEDPAAVWNSSSLISTALSKRNELSKSNPKIKQTGRVLLCAYDYTNHNGLTDMETKGYIDEHDNPPWDTWICEIECEAGNSSKIDYGESWPPNIGSILERQLLRLKIVMSA